MNLVKLQDDLKMLPMAVLQSKSQGQDPQVPPWLATAVLNERMDAQKKAGLAQGAQGDQPSIAEQLNQKAGLMALQGQQQQQAQQQMMSQMAQAPQPTPEGVPQPEQQPQPQMMAQGGLARLPVDSRMFDYRAGGIIGFSGVESSEVPEAAAIDTQRVEAAARAKKIKELEAKAKFLRDAGAPQAAQVEAELAALTQPASQPRPTLPPAGLPTALPKAPPPSPPAAPRPRVAPPAQPPVAAPPTGIQTALPQAAPAQSELEKKQMELLMKEPAAQTMDDIRAERKAAAPALLNEPAGLAQLARLKQQQEQYTKSQADRPYERLMSVLGAGGRGGAGSMTSGYLSAMQNERGADAAQSAYQDKVMTAIEAAQRGEATAEQNALLSGMGSSRTAQAEAAGKRLTAIGTARNTEAQTQVAGLDRASREKVAELDREMRERHYRNPISAPSEKERFVNDFVKAGMSRKAAIERVMGLDTKEGIAGDRINAANAKILFEDPRYMQAQKTLLDPNKSASEKAKAQITIDVAEKALGIQPQSSQPTMTPAQKAALEKYGAK